MKTQISEAKNIIETEQDRHEYRKLTNHAIALTYVVEGMLSKAEDVLRKNGEWKMLVKQQFKQASNAIRKITLPIDNQLKDDDLMDDVRFFEKLVYTLMECDISEDDQIKILSALKNKYCAPKVAQIKTND